MDEDGEDTDMEKERLEAEGMQMRCAITSSPSLGFRV
jgi:hypothetical protein